MFDVVGKGFSGSHPVISGTGGVAASNARLLLSSRLVGSGDVVIDVLGALTVNRGLGDVLTTVGGCRRGRGSVCVLASLPWSSWGSVWVVT